MKKINLTLLLILCMALACSCGNEPTGTPIGTEDVAVTTGGAPETNMPETKPAQTTASVTTTAPAPTTTVPPAVTTVPTVTQPTKPDIIIPSKPQDISFDVHSQIIYRGKINPDISYPEIVVINTYNGYLEYISPIKDQIYEKRFEHYFDQPKKALVMIKIKVPSWNQNIYTHNNRVNIIEKIELSPSCINVVLNKNWREAKEVDTLLMAIEITGTQYRDMISLIQPQAEDYNDPSDITDFGYQKFFGKAIETRGGYVYTIGMGPYFIKTQEELDSMLKFEINSYNPPEKYMDPTVTNQYYPDNVLDLCKKYDENYFKDNVLLVCEDIGYYTLTYDVVRVYGNQEKLEVYYKTNTIDDEKTNTPYVYGFFVELPKTLIGSNSPIVSLYNVTQGGTK